ncbi:FAD-dependent oxidoreductase [Sodalis ligni]|uniref:Succinate dehydrogenase/fumarate reductase flavoprotein subunit n=1 Tax=Sodalis ligni TaxID=2697027 RepID=A0A4R1NPH5_9GAMM|nr:FAD-binding protein [Sodalis ligni]TCL06270.1 succinate dehydrogenase/fumarate reductase flavoprotein subunit [Sodalis ligni]
MSVVKQEILEELTQVSFLRGFNKPVPDEIQKYNDIAIPVYEYEAVVIGTGAAGLRAAVELKRRNINVLIATSGLYMGTSACSGSDKQTLFTAATAKHGDSFIKLAEALSAGGGMDKDIAYVEAVGSIHTLAGLQFLGLELPEDRYGGILRYQTDHDEAGRATSCGPRTSRLMVKVLLDEVKRLNIPLISGVTALKMIQDSSGAEKKCAGLVVSTNSGSHNLYKLGVIRSPYVVLATGGPGDMYRDSVYPKKCYGSLGLALEANITLTNIIESQFGIGTPRKAFPWNLSGTYVQVIPYIYSIDKDDNERNFLANYYRTTQELASNIFRKGYQWPFHATRTVRFGSSLIDMAIAEELKLGNKVFMDFNRNPKAVPDDLPFSLQRLDEDVSEYLQNNHCDEEYPIGRLRRMNPLAIELYKMHGRDLSQHPLEFMVNNQHMNGGIDVDIWGESSLHGCFALGEVAGTHGVTRPGGAALNSGQVFGVRVAKKIAFYLKEDHSLDKNAETNLNVLLKEIISYVDISLNTAEITLNDIKDVIRNRMSDHAGFICSAVNAEDAYNSAMALYNKIMKYGIKINSYAQVPELILWRHFSLTSSAVLKMLTDYIAAGGGSRGARIILDDKGAAVPEGRTGKIEKWRFRAEREEDKNIKYLIKWQDDKFCHWQRPIREINNLDEIFFEKNWPDFLIGNIYYQ